MSWRILSVLVFLPLVSHVSADESWSKPVDGLRGRLVVPTDQKLDKDPFVRIYLELQNTLNVLGDRKIRYTDEALSLKVTDESGRTIPGSCSGYEGFTDVHQGVLMPFDSQLRFLINQHGADVPAGTAQIIDFGAKNCWIIAASDHHAYFLSGTMTIPEQHGDHPVLSWHGTLEFPRVLLPKN
jgi:hypothetical protein